jgi:hypothetical protein
MCILVENLVKNRTCVFSIGVFVIMKSSEFFELERGPSCGMSFTFCDIRDGVDDVHGGTIRSAYRVFEWLERDGAAVEWEAFEDSSSSLKAASVASAFFSPFRGGDVGTVLLAAFFAH